MILTIKNLGALKEAKIDLSKDLILLSGHNNTGKTYVLHAIYEYLNDNVKTNTQIFSSERATLNTELALNKIEFFDKLVGSNREDRIKLVELMDELPITENLLHLSEQKSDFDFLAIELEKSILEGKISVGQYGGLQYQPNFYDENKNGKEDNIILKIHQTSSSVKSLAPIVFYFRHLAKKNDCIIIDNPELNLHPDNQLLVARFLARLVNEGFKVIISTHSDYVIRELNNSLVLSNNFKEKGELMNTYGFKENDLLKYENIIAYYFEKEKNTAMVVPLLKRGVEIDSINLVISDLNESSDDIYYTFIESDENIAQEREETKKIEKNTKTN